MLNEFSSQLADAVEAAAPSVVQVQGHRGPASGIVYADGVVVTTMHALGGKEEGIHVRRHDGQTFDAELAGWDPTTRLVVLRVPSLGAPAIKPAAAPARVGQIALALARSWSNAVTASAGIVAVIGGPLPTGRRRAIDHVIRTTAPMHSGFAGGAFLDTTGALVGVATAAAIRGFGVVIPAEIAWKTVASVLEHGRSRRGYLGIVGQAVSLPESHAGAGGRTEALLVVGLTDGGPAGRAGMLVGDVLLALGEKPVRSPEDLLDRLVETPAGSQTVLRVLRGGTPVELAVTVGERPQ
jgi:S1-C subfamily serine protease